MEQTGNPRAFGKTPEVQPDTVQVEGGHGDEVQATAAEQSQYDLVASRALKYIHGQGREQVLKSMGSANSPAEGAGMVTAQLFRQIRDSAKQGGQELDDEILLNAAGEVVEDLMELGQVEGVFQFEDENESQEQADDAMLWAVQYFGQQSLSMGELDQDMARSAMQHGMAKENPAAAVTRGVRQELYPPQNAGGIVAPMMKGAQ